MITPLDIENKKFSKQMMNGYSVEEVDDFLDDLTICYEKTYKEIKSEIEEFSTALLNLGLENKKILLIGNNRYEWCVSYLAITTGNMVVVPLDKALPSGEIENLVKISKI